MTLQHQPPASAQCANLIQLLARQRLSPTALKVGLNYIAAWTRTGKTTFQVSNARLGSQLGVGRTALTTALASLVNIGFLARRPAANEGGVTITHLACTQGLPSSGHNRPHASNRPRIAANTPGRCRRDDRPRQQPVSQVGPVVTSTHAPVHTPTPSTERTSRTIPSLPPAQLLERITAITARLDTKSADQYRDARISCNPGLLPSAPSLVERGLSEEDIAILHSTIPVREKGPMQGNAAPPRPRGEIIDSKLALHIAQVAGPTGQDVGDQIAFAVTRGGLGRGDPHRGVLAAMSMVRNRSWGCPRGWQASWQGVLARSIAA